MNNELTRTYFKILLPSIIGFIITGSLKVFEIINFGPLRYIDFFAPAVFVLSVISAIAMPIFCRTIFANKMRDEKAVSLEDFVSFERRILYISLITPYLALIAFLFDFPKFHLAGSFLMAMYAAYYYYPSKRRITFDKRIFRVK
ncbi:MAG: hypothetical protein JXA79_01250 [Deltaproteobacteria bacterium]|nr:hypothetical protein [Deltaproteobacteria bacterium]